MLQHMAGTGAPPFAGSEHAHQVAFVEWCRWMAQSELPLLKHRFAVGNGGLRHPAIAGQLKAEGVEPGVPDKLLPVPIAPYVGLPIEMKAPGEACRGIGAVKPEQREWLLNLAELGWASTVAFGVDAARAIARWYLCTTDELLKLQNPLLSMERACQGRPADERDVEIAITVWPSKSQLGLDRGLGPATRRYLTLWRPTLRAE